MARTIEAPLTQRQMYQASHRKLMERIHAFAEIQAGDNPITKEEMEALIRRDPNRYSIFKGMGV